MPPWKTKKSIQPTEECLGEGGLARVGFIGRLTARQSPQVPRRWPADSEKFGSVARGGWTFLHGRRLSTGISGGQGAGEGSVCIKYSLGPAGLGVFLGWKQTLAQPSFGEGP